MTTVSTPQAAAAAPFPLPFVVRAPLQVRMLQMYSSDPSANTPVSAISPLYSQDGVSTDGKGILLVSRIKWIQDSVVAGSGVRGYVGT